jgi:HD-GYP domain-containing protein (c-di-GMP phosphodiesterase class II)
VRTLVVSLSIAVLLGHIALGLSDAGRSIPAAAAHVLATVALVVLAVDVFRRSKAAPEVTADDREGRLAIVQRLASAIDASDPFSRGRSYRVAHFSVRVAERMGLPPRQIRDLRFAAALHDIGRVAIRRDLLLKSGRLSDEERAVVRSHPQVAYEFLKDIVFLRRAAEIVLAHHEQPDGKGYPLGISGKKIPFGSRILMVTAAFEAMTSDRPYRRGLSCEEAYAELRRGAGTMFFSDVVETFIELHASGKLTEGMDETELSMFGVDDPATSPLDVGAVETASRPREVEAA